jgi:hypothetical protein
VFCAQLHDPNFPPTHASRIEITTSASGYHLGLNSRPLFHVPIAPAMLKTRPTMPGIRACSMGRFGQRWVQPPNSDDLHGISWNNHEFSLTRAQSMPGLLHFPPYEVVVFPPVQHFYDFALHVSLENLLAAPDSFPVKHIHAQRQQFLFRAPRALAE